MNNITISGNLTADATVRTTGEGKKVANFTVAVRGNKEHTDFIRCVMFGPAVDYVEKYGKKGARAVVAGSLHIGSYEKDGNKIPTADVFVRDIELTAKPAKADEAEVSAPSEDFAIMEDDVEELPFN